MENVDFLDFFGESRRGEGVQRGVVDGLGHFVVQNRWRSEEGREKKGTLCSVNRDGLRGMD